VSNICRALAIKICLFRKSFSIGCSIEKHAHVCAHLGCSVDGPVFFGGAQFISINLLYSIYSESPMAHLKKSLLETHFRVTIDQSSSTEHLKIENRKQKMKMKIKNPHFSKLCIPTGNKYKYNFKN